MKELKIVLITGKTVNHKNVIRINFEDDRVLIFYLGLDLDVHNIQYHSDDLMSFTVV